MPSVYLKEHIKTRLGLLITVNAQVNVAGGFGRWHPLWLWVVQVGAIQIHDWHETSRSSATSKRQISSRSRETSVQDR